MNLDQIVPLPDCLNEPGDRNWAEYTFASLEALRAAAFLAGRRYQAEEDAKVCEETEDAWADWAQNNSETRGPEPDEDCAAAIRRAAELIKDEK